jgi:DHA1 family multidrug resistance protein-like MFS transporter
MNLGQLGLVFLTSVVGTVIVLPFYFIFLHYTIKRVKPTHPEQRLIPALLASLLVPVGLFIFAWTSRESIHWIIPTAGVLLVMMGAGLIFQCLFTYISITYPRYAASLLAMNSLVRCSLAFASILWSAPLYQHLGVARGTTLIGGLTIGCVLGIFTLYFLGPELRKRSRFAE